MVVRVWSLVYGIFRIFGYIDGSVFYWVFRFLGLLVDCDCEGVEVEYGVFLGF